MTDELSPEFLAFSEMLDQKELPEDVLSLEDASLLLELRRELQGDPTRDSLPTDFAKSTAAAVAARFESQPVIVKRLLRWDSLWRTRALSPRGLGGLLLMTGGAYGLYLVSPALLLGVGLLTLLGLGSLQGLYAKFLPGVFDFAKYRSLPEVNLPKLYYLMPLVAVFGTAALSGWAVGSLDDLSLSVRASGAPVDLAGVATAGVVFLWLFNALLPIWKVSSQRVWTALFAIWLHGAWLWGLSMILTGREYMARFTLGYALLCLAVSAAVAFAPKSFSLNLTWRKALGRFVVGLLTGLLPVAAALVVTYQMILTRNLKPEIEPLYQAARKEISDWEKSQQKIPPSENGFEELKPFFIRSLVNDRSDPKAFLERKDVVKRLKAGNLLWRENFPAGGRQDNKAERDLARKEFLEELPRIRSAVSKPRFSYLGQEAYSWSTEVPNYILCRAISQALAGLSDESLTQGETAKALDYLRLNLRWSTKVNQGTLISLMIGVAQNRIATLDLERLIFEGRPSEAQLRSLAAVLDETSLKRTSFRDTMIREVILSDRFLHQLATAKGQEFRGAIAQMLPYDAAALEALATILPSEFWLSESRALVNLMLSQEREWRELALTGEEDLQQILERNPAASWVVPNVKRAEIQFAIALTRMAALRTVVALELYKMKHGDYPDSLQSLVPEYLPELPVDAIQPKRWAYKGTFEYHKIGAKYELVSESPLYSEVQYSTPQVYGPDGDYEEASTKAR